MFSGIVEEIGILREVRLEGEPMQLVIDCRAVLEGARVGDSIAVNGVCLTVESFDEVSFTTGVMPETLRRTDLGRLGPGAGVNLERSVPAEGRVGGHFVQGHVDGTGELLEMRPDGAAVIARIGVSPRLARYVVEKGYVAVDGTSLTVVEAGADYFTVSLVYHTQEHITLPRKSAGDLVNIEVDILAKYAERFAESGEPLPTDTRELAGRVGVPSGLSPDGGEETAMPLATVAEALEELRSGRFVIVVDDEQRENEGDLVIAAEHTTPEAINFMAREGRGLICLAMTGERLDSLGIPLMVPPERNTSPYRTAFTISVEARQGITTGISAHDRARTVRVLADPATRPEDVAMPGHVFPLRARDGGVLERPGHTEASVDLARLAGMLPAAVICEIMAEDGQMARIPELERLAARHGLKVVTVADLVAYRGARERVATRAANVDLPTRHGRFALIAYPWPRDREPDLALVRGDLTGGEPPLVRLHSECLTGDVFASARCDCGSQLDTAMELIDAEGRGAVLYLRQEGRGIGLLNKLRAYELQEQGLDTVEANERLGFRADERDYLAAALILRDLGLDRVRLLTNNPRKVAGLEAHGVEVVERVPIELLAGPDNLAYLHAKRAKLGHALGLPAEIRKVAGPTGPA